METRITTLESSILALAQSQAELARTTNAQISELVSIVKSQVTPTSSGGNSNNESNGGGTSSAPQTPAISVFPGSTIKSSKGVSTTILDFDPSDSSKKSPLIEQTPIIEKETEIPQRIPEIIALKPFDSGVNFEEQIVCADLEALISPEGLNQVYQAAWYNGKRFRIFDISEFEYSVDRMLKAFWLNLIKMNKGKVCFFHNWAGYDSILSLPQLLASSSSYSFEPIFNRGQLMSIKVIQNGTEMLTIKDSIRILPGALSKLAKDWGAETQKDHFPHYFLLDTIPATLKYKGPIPSYSCFEPKRTSKKDYEELVSSYKGRKWSFLKVSEQYILNDCKALYQIMVKFFDTFLFL